MANPGRYTLLLNQVQQVSAELQEARLLIASFKRENEELIGNFETCKGQLIDTRDKYQRCQAELLEATERQVMHRTVLSYYFRQILSLLLLLPSSWHQSRSKGG
jgi:hypothetical protein